MTLDHAKAVLNLCPPDDHTNPDIPGLDKAQELVATNAELAAWWEQEKNFDLTYSRKLASLTPPKELLPTILRGGATIFFASRLIAESTGETVPELPPTPDIPEAKKNASRALEHLTAELAAQTSSKKPSPWYWRTAIVVAMIVVALLVGLMALFALFYLRHHSALVSNP